MKNEKAVFEFGNEYRCVQFTDVDPDASGVEVFNGDKRLGSIIDLHIPDIDDEEANIKFDKEVIDWIIENE